MQVFSWKRLIICDDKEHLFQVDKAEKESGQEGCACGQEEGDPPGERGQKCHGGCNDGREKQEP